MKTKGRSEEGPILQVQGLIIEFYYEEVDENQEERRGPTPRGAEPTNRVGAEPQQSVQVSFSHFLCHNYLNKLEDIIAL